VIVLQGHHVDIVRLKKLENISVIVLQGHHVDIVRLVLRLVIVLQGHHVDIVRLKEIGEHFCDALACLHSQLYWRRGVMACSPGPLRFATLVLIL